MVSAAEVAALPLSAASLLTTSLVLVATFLAAGAGIGGGGLLVPIFILRGYAAKHAIPMSEATIFGAMVTNFAFNSRARHPRDKRRPLIDYDAALCFEGAALIGTVFGVLANRVLPEWSILALLVLLLGYSSLRTYRKALKAYRKESGELQAAGSRAESVCLKSASKSASVDESGPLQPSVALERVLREERECPVDLCSGSLLVSVWLLTTACSFARGNGPALGLDVACGSPIYWTLTFVPVLGLLAFLVFARRRTLDKYALKRSAGYPFAEGDIDWSSGVDRNLALMTGAGLSAGLLGIGGGMVQGPLMLELGMLPQVQRGTSATMILFTASSAALQFLFMGQLPEGMTGFLYWLAAGAAGTALGQIVMKGLLRRFKRASLIVFFLAGVIALSCLMMAVTGSRDVAMDISSGSGLGLSSVC